MHAKMMLKIRKSLKDEGVSFCYCGYMTQSLLMAVSSILIEQMASTKLGKRKGKAVFSVVVELMQGIITFSAERLKQAGTEDLSYGVLAVGESGYKIFSSCGSILHASDAGKFKKYLDKIRILDGKELKTLWKEVLRGDDATIPGHAQDALASFIEITRRAKGDIAYEFIDISRQWVFFNIKAYL